MTIVLMAFIIGGLICVIGQLLFDLTPLTPAHVLSLFVVFGVILGGIGWYQPIIEFAGAGATVPVISFGNAMVSGAIEEAKRDGLIGILTGTFEITSAGVSAAIIFGFFTSVFFKPKG